MNRQNQSSFLRTLAASLTAFGSAAVLLFPFSTIATHGRDTTLARSEKSRNAARRPDIAKLQASDSPEGSRVALIAGQSLNDYEAYRRGDRFYVRIPAADVPHAEDLRARAFTDVKVEQTADATFVIFHLWPGVTARVEQWGRKLEIVFTVSRPRFAGSTPVGPAGIRKNRRSTSIPTDSKRDLNAGTIRSKTTIPTSKVANSARRAANQVSEDHRTSTIVLPAAPRARASSETEPSSVKSSQTSQLAVSSLVPEPETRSPAAAATAPASRAEISSWDNLKRHARYWVRITQLNPVPVGVGVAILLLFLGFVFLQRRGTRRSLCVGSLTQSYLPEGLGKSRPAFETADFAQCAPAAETPQTESNSRGRAFGAPGTGQVIDKLVLDNAHRADVMDSRSPEDRKAIEASLINLITADIEPEDRRRARAALEEYGFVARHCATLLTGRDGWERASAARTLAQIGSQSSLPFLIEALHDDDSIVRNQAVASLASLKDPAAIGALLEAARTHPDVPASLLSETLSACSVDSLGPLDLPSAETALLWDAVDEDKADLFQELAAIEDDVLSGSLEQLDSADGKLEAVPDSLPPFTEAHERPYLTLVA